MTIDWQEVIALFETDDGSLPDIEIDNLSGEEVISGYEFVRNSAESLATLNPYYWSTTQNREIPIKFADNPSIHVVSGEAESFHLCFDGIKSPMGKTIPTLGLFVFPDGLNFDYRMGSDWNLEAVQGLFEFLDALSKKFKEMQLSHTNIYDDGTILRDAFFKYSS